MKKYDRAKQKRLNLISVSSYTNNEDDEETNAITRKSPRRSVSNRGNNDGEGWGLAKRACSKNWSPEAEYQQDHDKGESRQSGLPLEDDRGPGVGSGHQDQTTKVTREAA